MSSEARAAIPRPSICRNVIVSRKDGAPFVLGTARVGAARAKGFEVREVPVMVVRVEREEDLAIIAMNGLNPEVFPHKDLCDPSLPDDALVWSWPPRS